MAVPDATEALNELPADLREEVLKAFNKIRRNYAEHRWEPSELNGGKLCEVVFRILEWHTNPDNSYTDFDTSIRDFGSAVRRFENQTQFADSVRFHIPNALHFLYTVRNKRSVGHVGGDVDPNHMDAKAVVGTANWIVAELVRIFHHVSIDEAQNLVEALVEKRIPVVWEVAGRRRVLEADLGYKDTTLLLLYNDFPEPADARRLHEWCEAGRYYDYERRTLSPLHDNRLIEYDDDEGMVYLSPKGVRRVEALLEQRGWEI